MGIRKVFYRSPHNYDLDEASDEASIKEFGPSLTVQSMAEDVDINVIMKRFGITGRMPENVPPLMYGDFTDVFDFRTANERVIAARESFMAMPAELRARFGNDPQMFMDFCEARSEDGKKLANLDEMRKLGLALPEKLEVIPPPVRVSVVNPTPPTGSSSSSSGGGGSVAPGST